MSTSSATCILLFIVLSANNRLGQALEDSNTPRIGAVEGRVSVKFADGAVQVTAFWECWCDADVAIVDHFLSDMALEAVPLLGGGG